MKESTFNDITLETESNEGNLSDFKNTITVETFKPPIPAWVGPMIFGFSILLFYAVSLNFYALPAGVLIENESDNPGRFIAERAQNMLEQFVKIGQKVVGSVENEVLAVEFLKEEIAKINASRNANVHDIEMMLTRHSNSYYLGYKPYGMLNYYSNVQNLVVRLKPAGQEPETSVMINAHFDSVPVSPGASDDGIAVMIMLEILRILSQTDQPFRHSIIFLFNGAEEGGLLAAHGFTQDHPWAKSVKTVLNCDSTGSGGREILFQAHPDHSWLIKFYKKYAPHPYASAMGEELFQANLVPSDSDFRIFRDFGNMPAMDFAYAYNGYVYHTKYDRFGIIPIGTYQHTGDNLLEVTKALANAAELDVDAELPDGKTVFFDYLGWFMISYTDTEAIIINSIIAAASIVIMLASMYFIARRSSLQLIEVCEEFCLVFVIQFVSIALAAGLCLLLAVIYDAVGRSLSWYSNPYILFGIYFCPFYLVSGLGPVLYLTFRKNFKLQIGHEVLLFLHAHNFLLTLFLIILTGLQIRSAFILLIIVVFYSATTLINLISGLQDKAYHWVYVHIVGQLFPFMFYCHLSLIAFTTFIPMSARGGPASNPELLICVFSIGMALLLGGFLVPIVGLCHRSTWIISGFGVFFLIGCILMATPAGFPYKADVSAQRHWIYHTKREFYNYSSNTIRKSDSGFLLLPMDRHSTREYLEDEMEQIKTAEKFPNECEEELVCGMPFYSSRMFSQANYSLWVPANEPYLNKPVTLVQVVNQVPEGRYEFELSGPDRMGIFISPAPGVVIKKWSFLHYITDSGPLWSNRETFTIIYTAGIINLPFTFWLDLEIPSSIDPTNSPVIYIGIAAHYTHFDSERTDEFKSFIDSFPDWTHVTAWMSSFHGYEF